MRSARGFTLIEVMVALVIVGMALPVFLVRMQSLLDHTGHMNSKTYAYWLAENKMQELLIDSKIKGNVSKTRKREEEEEFAGQQWFWKVEVEETAVKEIYRMEVTVGLARDEPLAALSGFIRE